jgi:Uma2 family endonuclease
MSADTATTSLMTTEQMLALPENGMDRELIRGELREREMTRRNRPHSQAMANITNELKQWLKQQPAPRGAVVCGEAGFRIRRNPDTTVGIDVAYASSDLATRTPKNARLFEGPPVQAVEILSPSDKHQDIIEKVEAYQESGVTLIWIVDPDLETVLVLRAGEKPALFNVGQDLTGDPELPGFRMPVADVFDF